MPILPGAEPFRHDGGPTGVLLCHGFTSTPQSLRPWASHLAGRGLTVRLPLLPGHGTNWRDLHGTTSGDWLAAAEEELLELAADHSPVFVFGLSMGACLALRLARMHPDTVRGVVAVNPSLAVENRLLHVAGLLHHLVPTAAAIAGDIARPGARETAYDRVPLAAAATLLDLWRDTRSGLPELKQPILVYRSRRDRVVGSASVRILRREATQAPLTVRMCEESRHVATLDNDAEKIFAGSLAFVAEHEGVLAAEPPRPHADRNRRVSEEGAGG